MSITKIAISLETVALFDGPYSLEVALTLNITNIPCFVQSNLASGVKSLEFLPLFKRLF